MHTAGEDVVILSPHCDDAVLSLGATAYLLAEAGRVVRAITVFAGRLDSQSALSPWDRACGFRSGREAIEGRRAEDIAAWRVLGIKPLHLDLDAHDSDGTVVDRIVRCTEMATIILVPGFPLTHPDHRRIRDLALRSLPRSLLAFYVEQPYELQYAWAHARRSSESTQTPSLPWCAIPAQRRIQGLKRRAIREYASQLRPFRPLLPERILLREWLAGGERLRLADHTRAWADIAVPN